MVFGLDDLAIMGIAGSAIGSTGSFIGGLLGQSGQNAANQQMMQFNANQSFQNQMFQERMRNTAYQVAMYDMQKAGLNPILAAGTGGAAVPSGSAASVNLGNAGDFLGRGVSSASQAVQKYADFRATMTQAQKDASAVPVNETTSKLNEANTAVSKATEAKTMQETATSAAQQGWYISNTGVADQTKANLAVDNAIKHSEAMTAASAAKLKAMEEEQTRTTGKGHLSDVITTVGRGARSIIGGAADVIKEQTAPGSPQPSPSAKRPGTFQVEPKNVPGFSTEQYRR